MIHPIQLRDHAIGPTLRRLKLYSPAAETLLLGTAIAESTVGGETYLKQIRGPALGIYQIEPATHDDIWRNFLAHRGELRAKVRSVMSLAAEREGQLIWNLAYATAIARLVYYRQREPLPPAGDIEAIARYWKRHYNTRLGAGTVAGFIAKAGPFIG